MFKLTHIMIRASFIMMSELHLIICTGIFFFDWAFRSVQFKVYVVLQMNFSFSCRRPNTLGLKTN